MFSTVDLNSYFPYRLYRNLICLIFHAGLKSSIRSLLVNAIPILWQIYGVFILNAKEKLLQFQLEFGTVFIDIEEPRPPLPQHNFYNFDHSA